MNWVVFSIISTAAFAGITLVLKKLTQSTLSSEIINFYFFLVTAGAFLLFALYKKTPVKADSSTWIWFGLLAGFAFVANYYGVTALKAAPNPGYVRAIQTLQIVLVTIAGIYLFDSAISAKTIAGIILAVFAVYLISS